MNPNYNLRQQKIYEDYSPKSDEELTEILNKRNNYLPGIIDIVTDILEERKKLPGSTTDDDELVEEEELSPEDQEIYNLAADLLFKQKNMPKEAIRIIVGNGYDQERTEIMVNRLQAEVVQVEQEQNQQDIQSGVNDMFVGAAFFIIGVVVTAVTYANASGGGTYVIAWGAIVFGAIRFFKGLAKSETSINNSNDEETN